MYIKYAAITSSQIKNCCITVPGEQADATSGERLKLWNEMVQEYLRRCEELGL